MVSSAHADVEIDPEDGGSVHHQGIGNSVRVHEEEILKNRKGYQNVSSSPFQKSFGRNVNRILLPLYEPHLVTQGAAWVRARV
jgi:hypothetical protein